MCVCVRERTREKEREEETVTKRRRESVKTIQIVCLSGSITMEDLISVLPFGGTFDMVQMKGTTLLKVFEHSVRRYGGSTGEFLQVSGSPLSSSSSFRQTLSSKYNSQTKLYRVDCRRFRL